LRSPSSKFIVVGKPVWPKDWPLLGVVLIDADAQRIDVAVDQIGRCILVRTAKRVVAGELPLGIEAIEEREVVCRGTGAEPGDRGERGQSRDPEQQARDPRSTKRIMSLSSPTLRFLNYSA